MTAWVRIISVVGLPTVIAAAGCAVLPNVDSTTPNQSRLPPRPTELRLDSVTNVCGLLTPGQLRQLGVTRGSDDQSAYQGGLNDGPNCGWPGLSLRPLTSYGARMVLNHGAAAAQGSEPPRQVGGFAAVLTAAPGFDPNYNCGLMVDVAPDQTLMAEYGNTSKDIPGMNRQLACDKAQQLAEMLLANLRARLGK